MNKLVNKTGWLLWLAIGIVGIYVACIYNVGVKVDYIAWTTEIEKYEKILYHGLAISAIGFVLMAGLAAILKQRKVTFVLCSLILCVSVIALFYSFMAMPNWQQIHEKQNLAAIKENKNKFSEINEIEWIDVLEKHRGENYFLLFVGTDNCKACLDFTPKLAAAAKAEDVGIVYYNTKSDREKKDIDQKMNMLKIDSVPALRIIGKNKIVPVDDEKIMANKDIAEQYLKHLKRKYSLDHE